MNLQRSDSTVFRFVYSIVILQYTKKVLTHTYVFCYSHLIKDVYQVKPEHELSWAMMTCVVMNTAACLPDSIVVCCTAVQFLLAS
jgi:hypothetical protein